MAGGARCVGLSRGARGVVPVGGVHLIGEVLPAREKEVLRWGAKLMTLECGIRFLTDYLEGAHYFHTARPDHNHDRARTQFTLVRQMEEVFGQMLEIVS